MKDSTLCFLIAILPSFVLILYHGNLVKFVGANVIADDVLVTISFMWVGMFVFLYCGYSKRREELRMIDRRTD